MVHSKTLHAFELQEKTGEATSWFRADGTLDAKLFAASLKEVDDQALRQALVRLKDAAALSGSELEEHLLLCRGPGVMCAVAAALPNLYLQGSPVTAAGNFELPPGRLELDMRGRMDVVPGKYAYVDIGEVKRKPEYGDAIAQLGLRLATLGWFVQTCCSVPEKDVRLVGRMMVPIAMNESSIAADQRDKADRLWNFSLYLHTY